jgi:hypothetical protein
MQISLYFVKKWLIGDVRKVKFTIAIVVDELRAAVLI